MQNIENIKAYKKEDIVSIIFGISVIICSIFTGGLYWYTCIIPLVLAGVCILLRFKEIKLNSIIFSVVILALAIINLFSTKGDFQVGVHETEKIILFVSALLIGSSIKKRDNIIALIYSAGAICAVVGILAYCGLFDAGEMLLKNSGQVRLQSFFKYANTTACFLGMGYFSSVEMFSKTKKSVHLYLGVIILVAMYLTLSKAVIPMFLAVGLYYIIRKKECAALFVNNNIYVFVFILPIIWLVKEYMYFAALVLIAVYAIIAVNVKLIKSETVAIKLWIAFLFCIATGGIVLLNFKPGLFSTLFQRFTYMKDSIDCLTQNIVLGNGPGSWRVLKYAIQSNDYNAIYMHNGFLQFVFENGLLFAIAVLGMAIKTIVRGVKQKNDCIVTIMLILILHSFIDFDLSFGAILMIFGVISGSVCFDEKATAKCKIIHAPLLILIIGSVCFSCIYMVTEYTQRTSFERACIEEEYDIALKKAYQLEKICPKDSTLQLNIASLIEKTTGNTDKIKRKLKKACELSPSEPAMFEAYIDYNMTEENLKDLCIKYINMRPRNEGTHQKVKEFINKAYSDGIIKAEYKDSLIAEMENIRFDLKVYDRDELLDRIMKQKETERKEGD